MSSRSCFKGIVKGRSLPEKESVMGELHCRSRGNRASAECLPA